VYHSDESDNILLMSNEVNLVYNLLRYEFGMNLPPRAQEIKIDLEERSLAQVTCTYLPMREEVK